MLLQDAAALVGGQFDIRHSDVEITGLASVNEAEPGQITFYGNPKYLGALRATKAAAALVPNNFQEEVAVPTIRVENPTAAFAVIVEAFSPPPIPFSPGIHPTAVIGAGAQIAEDASIQPYAVIEPGVTIGARTIVGAHCYVGHECSIGEDCHLHAHVSIRERCLIGNRVILHNGVVVGSDGFGYELINNKHTKIPQVGIVQIDDDVEVGANTTIDRARFGRTWIQAGTKIDNLVQIAHNITIGQHSILCAQVGISGSTKVGNYVTLAGQVGVNGHIQIGDGAIVTAKAGITKSVKPKEILVGLPAKPMKDYKENYVLLQNISKLYQRVKDLETKLAERE